MLGLNARERADFIVFWLKEVHASKFVVLRFVDEGFLNENVVLEIDCEDEK